MKHTLILLTLFSSIVAVADSITLTTEAGHNQVTVNQTTVTCQAPNNTGNFKRTCFVVSSNFLEGRVVTVGCDPIYKSNSFQDRMTLAERMVANGSCENIKAITNPSLQVLCKTNELIQIP